MDRANGDLSNEFASTGIATVFLDHDLVIRAFSPAAAQLFDIIAADKGRPLTDLVTKLDYADLSTDLRAVLTTGMTIEWRTHRNDVDAPYYLARLIAHRNSVPARFRLKFRTDALPARHPTAYQRGAVALRGHRMRVYRRYP